MLKKIFVILILVLSAGCCYAIDVYLSLSAHGQRLELGFAGFIPQNATIEDTKLCREIQDVLRYDLLFSRYFNISEGGPLYTGKDEELQEWVDIGANTLICGKLKRNESGLVLIGQLLDIASKQVIWESTYVGTENDYRRIAHELNDDIVLRFTGEKGIAHTKIAFVNKRGWSKELFLVDYDGYNLRQLTWDESLNLLPKWSPDGDEILYTTYRFGNPDLYSIYPKTGRRRAVSYIQGLNTTGAFSPDGTKIVLTVSHGTNPNLYLLERSGKIIRKMTVSQSIDTSPSFAPNGKEIVFISDRPGYPQLYIMNLEGGNLRRITTPGFCDSPAWSPRGDKIAFTMRLGRQNYDLYIYDLTKSRILRLTEDERNNENPSWSPDGRFIVFSSNRTGTNELHIIGADGSGIRKLGEIPGNSSTPSWSP